MSARRKGGTEGETKIFSEKDESRSFEEEDFEEAMRETASTIVPIRNSAAFKQQIVTTIPEAVDDFLRNFLLKAGLSRTLKSFEAEWYNSVLKALAECLTMASTSVYFLPDALAHKQLLLSELQIVCRERDKLRQEVLVAGDSLVRMRRERDFHQLQYQRVAEDKNRLISNLKQLKKHLESYEPMLRQLDDKYQAAVRRKMLIGLKKDKIQNTTEVILNPEKLYVKEERSIKRNNSTGKSPSESTVIGPKKDNTLPICFRQVNCPQGQMNSEMLKVPRSFRLSCSIKAHQLPISCISPHPKKRIIASASDDCSWRLWALPSKVEKVGEMMLSGEGHSDWLSGCSFHPDGEKLATTSGDTTVRLWDFSCGRCVLVLSGHCQPTWGCSFHSNGCLLASCSADRTAKLWDLNSQRCRLTLRRHTASVNSVCFLPLSDLLLLTASADKTLAMWDARGGVCTTIFHGHQHPCNHAAFTLMGNIVASCDSHGILNLWNIKKPALPMSTIDVGPMAANQLVFCPSGKRLAVASSDSLVRIVEVDSCVVHTLSGHRDEVQSVMFDDKGGTVMSAGSDGVINIWS